MDTASCVSAATSWTVPRLRRYAPPFDSYSSFWSIRCPYNWSPRLQLVCNNSGGSGYGTKSKSSTKSSGKSSKTGNNSTGYRSGSGGGARNVREELREIKETPKNVSTLYQNGDPLGWRDLGKSVVRWISRGMKAMATDFVEAEMQGEFLELKQRMEPGLTFVIQAQPYLSAIPMPLGLEAICLKACTHYPTLFDNFQRELRDVLQDLQHRSVLKDWRETDSWKLLKELANSGCS